MMRRNIFQTTILLGVVYLLIGCRPSEQPPEVGEVIVNPSTTIMTGDQASLTIPVSGSNLEFNWVTQRGTLVNNTQPAVIYTAPDSPGPDVVTVQITSGSSKIIKSIYFEIVAPPTPTARRPTATPVPVDTPTQTPIPRPISCNNLSVTGDVFPQLADGDGQFPFYGPLEEPGFSCEGVYDNVHSGSLAIRIRFEASGDNFGFWGIGTPNGYDASPYRSICFWAYAEEPSQSFLLRLKDTLPRESGITIILDQGNEWQQVCTSLTEFSKRGIQLDQLENVNLGFDINSGSVEIWADDFEFR